MTIALDAFGRPNPGTVNRFMFDLYFHYPVNPIAASFEHVIVTKDDLIKAVRVVIDNTEDEGYRGSYWDGLLVLLPLIQNHESDLFDIMYDRLGAKGYSY